jgi:hypothetical protein
VKEEKTLVIVGSLMQAELWRPTNVHILEGQTVSIEMIPMDAMQKTGSYRRDSVVFRLGRLGPEYRFDSAARATWHQKDKWIDESVMRFTAEAAGELVYQMRQGNKFTVRIKVK